MKIYKRGTSQYLSLAFMFLLVFVGITIVACVMIYFNSVIDVKYYEARAMCERIISTISYNGYLNNNVFDDNYDLLNESGISKEIMENSGNFYITLILNDSKNFKQIKKGNSDFEIQCEFNTNNFAKCFNKNLILLDQKDNGIIRVNLICGANEKAR